VLATALATVSSDQLAAQNNPEKIGEQAVAVVTQNSDGSCTIHCVVHGDGVVNAALASYFGANKEAINQHRQQAGVTQDNARSADTNSCYSTCDRLNQPYAVLHRISSIVQLYTVMKKF